MEDCLLCGALEGHKQGCPQIIKIGEDGKPIAPILDELAEDELNLYKNRAREWLANENDADLITHLNTVALVGMQKLTKSAIMPGGKDPASTALRAIRELVELSKEWTDAREAKPKELNKQPEKRSKRIL